MPLWTLDLPADPAWVADRLAAGLVLALDLDPRDPSVVLTPRQPGLGDALVGQRVVVRRWLGASGATAVTAAEVTEVLTAARRWLDTVEAGRLLRTVSEGYRCSRMWSGDALGQWSEPAWSAAHAVGVGVIAAMEGAPEGERSSEAAETAPEADGAT